MKMQLNNLERILLFNLMKPEGDLIGFKILFDFKCNLSFNENEKKEIGIEQIGEQIRWKKSIEKEFEITDTIKGHICSQLEIVEKQKRVNEENASLFFKFKYEEYVLQKSSSQEKEVKMKPV